MLDIAKAMKENGYHIKYMETHNKKYNVKNGVKNVKKHTATTKEDRQEGCKNIK